MGWTPGELLRAARRQRRAPAHRSTPSSTWARRKNVKDLLARQDKAGRHAVGEHHRRGPLRRRRLRRPLGRAERAELTTGRSECCHPGRPGALPAGRAARPRRHPRASRDCAWRHRRGRQPARHLRAEEPARWPTAGTGSPTPTTATGCPTRSSGSRASPGSSAARSASARCAPGWSTATSWTGSPAPTGSAKGKQVSPRTLRLLRAHQPRLRRRAGAQARRPPDGLRGGRRRRGLRRAGGVGRHAATSTASGRTSSRSSGSGCRPTAAWEVPVRPRAPAGHPARPQREQRRGRPGDARRAGLPAASKGIPFDAPWGSLQVAGDEGAPPIPLGGGDAGAGNANAAGQPDAGGRTRTAATRSATAPPTSRRSRSSTAAGSTRTRS